MSFNQTAYQNRSLRTIITELEFLRETSVLTPTQLSSILSILPPPPSTPASISSVLANNHRTSTPAAQPQSATPAVPHMGFTPPMSPPASTKTPAHEKAMQPISGPTPPAPPPSYTPTALVISRAEAVWAFNGTEPEDLSFNARDTIEVLEKVKDDWWRGRVLGGSPEIGLFPSSYVREMQQMSVGGSGAGVPGLPPRKEGGYNGYGPGGNMMTDVAHAGPSNSGAVQNGGGGEYEPAEKKSTMGKNAEKFGKKLGNATIFGAGATLGGKVVNSII